MRTVNAFAIHQIGTRIAGVKTFIRASEKGKPSVFLTTEAELEKLEALGAARKATSEEVAVAEVQESIVDASVKEAAAETPKSDVGDGKPASGAAGDPQGAKPGKGTKPAEPKADPKSESGNTGANDADI